MDGDLELREGSVTGLLGINGAGKTTLLRTALGLARADEGRASAGEDQPIFTRVSLRKAYSGTGRLSGAGPCRMRPDVS